MQIKTINYSEYIIHNLLLIEIESQPQKPDDLGSHYLIALPFLHSHVIAIYPDMG